MRPFSATLEQSSCDLLNGSTTKARDWLIVVAGCCMDKIFGQRVRGPMVSHLPQIDRFVPSKLDSVISFLE